MINMIRNWILSIVAIIIFSTLADILLPEGGLKKLSKLVIGLIVVIVVLNPILSLLNNRDSVSTTLGNYIDSFSIEGNAKASNINRYSDETIEVFKDNLKASIELEISKSSKIKYKVVGLSINRDQDSKAFLEVKGITLSEVNNSIKIKGVDKIQLKDNRKQVDKLRNSSVIKLLENKFNIGEAVIKFER